MKKLAMNSLDRSRTETGMPISTKHRQLKPFAQRRHGSVCSRNNRVRAASISFSRGFQAVFDSESKSPVIMPNAACAILLWRTRSNVCSCSRIAGGISASA